MFPLLAVELFTVSTKPNNLVCCYNGSLEVSSLVPSALLMTLPWYAIRGLCARLLLCAGTLNCTPKGLRMCAIRSVVHTYVSSPMCMACVHWYMHEVLHVPITRRYVYPCG